VAAIPPSDQERLNDVTALLDAASVLLSEVVWPAAMTRWSLPTLIFVILQLLRALWPGHAGFDLRSLVWTRCFQR